MRFVLKGVVNKAHSWASLSSWHKSLIFLRLEWICWSTSQRSLFLVRVKDDFSLAFKFVLPQVLYWHLDVPVSCLRSPASPTKSPFADITAINLAFLPKKYSRKQVIFSDSVYKILKLHLHDEIRLKETKTTFSYNGFLIEMTTLRREKKCIH